MTEFSSKWQNFSPEGSGIAVSKVSKAPSETSDTSIAEGLSQKNSTACTCPTPSGPAGCGPNYPVCSACGYVWRCPTCQGCRQCASPGRKVKTQDADLPFLLGNLGLDPIQIEMAERSNTRLGVVDPVDRRLNVLFWLLQHYQESDDSDMAAQVKAAYYSLRDADPDVVRLTRIGELDEATLLRRLVNGQRWLSQEHERWATDSPDAASAADFQKALNGWSEMEKQLRDQHGYAHCLHGPDGCCPDGDLDVVQCVVCAISHEGQTKNFAEN